MAKKIKRLSDVDEFDLHRIAQDIWGQLSNGEVDALLVMFQMNPYKTNISAFELYNFAKAWKANNREVRNYVLHCTLERMSKGLDKPRKPGFMLA